MKLTCHPALSPCHPPWATWRQAFRKLGAVRPQAWEGKRGMVAGAAQARPTILILLVERALLCSLAQQHSAPGMLRSASFYDSPLWHSSSPHLLHSPLTSSLCSDQRCSPWGTDGSRSQLQIRNAREKSLRGSPSQGKAWPREPTLRHCGPWERPFMRQGRCFLQDRGEAQTEPSGLESQAESLSAPHPFPER